MPQRAQASGFPDETVVPVAPLAPIHERVCLDGKFLRAGAERFLIKGVTYGTFAPDRSGAQFPPAETIARDFALMAAHGVNTVRTYTLPDRRCLDQAAAAGLRVMVGLPWSQHIAFLADRRGAQDIRRAIARAVRSLADHPAALLFALGNEIPAPVVRWHGNRTVEQFLRGVYDAAKDAAPESLLTYVNFPPTDYLDLPFVDLVAYNVYLHRESDFEAYLTQLQYLAGHRPLLLAELGADSQRQGLEGQAELTAMQLRAAYRGGACGAVAFAWTDEWWRGGFTVEDWAFGLVDTDRRPKPALAAVARVFADAPFAPEVRAAWPRVSVVVCAYNAADTIDECLRALEALDYPDYEVIVINDGSRDRTSDLARRHPIARVIDVPNGGLSAARNLGLQHATGAIVAYTDADVRVDRSWLTFLVQPMLPGIGAEMSDAELVGSGGPNVVPADDPWMAQCVARAPGGPTHVLLDNRVAEHVPGCNMAFRRDVLLDIGGFDPLYRRAGDDVDLCWRIQARGWKIGFAPAALVWHRHRASIRAYWRQQVGYGEGEQWLLPHHPDRFRGGHAIWRGQIYSPLPYVRALSRAKVNTGPWGTAAFPSIYLQNGYAFAFMPHKVRWLTASGALIAAGAAAAVFERTDLAALFAGLGAIGVGTTVVMCVAWAVQSDIRGVGRSLGPRGRSGRAFSAATIAWLHFIQPFARAVGRIQGMLADVPRPALDTGHARIARPSVREILQAPVTFVGLEWHFWGEEWTPVETFLGAIRDRLQSASTVRALEIDDGWQQSRDIAFQVSRWSWLDLRALVEDHGSGRRLARVAVRQRLSRVGLLLITLIAAVAVTRFAAPLRTWESAIAFGGVTAGLALLFWETSRVLAVARRAVVRAAAACRMKPVRAPRAASAPPQQAAPADTVQSGERRGAA